MNNIKMTMSTLNKIRLAQITCPCNCQGILCPYEYLPLTRILLVCDECGACWMVNSLINLDQKDIIQEYVEQHDPEKDILLSYENGNRFVELKYETLLNNIPSYGQFPPEFTNFNIYINNCHLLLECHIEVLFMKRYICDDNLSFIEKGIQLNNIDESMTIPKHNSIMEYENSMTHNYERKYSNNPFVHIVHEGYYQMYHKRWNSIFKHIVYDTNNEILYLYQLQYPQSKYFVDASKLHELFYPCEYL